MMRYLLAVLMIGLFGWVVSDGCKKSRDMDELLGGTKAYAEAQRVFILNQLEFKVALTELEFTGVTKKYRASEKKYMGDEDAFLKARREYLWCLHTHKKYDLVLQTNKALEGYERWKP